MKISSVQTNVRYLFIVILLFALSVLANKQLNDTRPTEFLFVAAILVAVYLGLRVGLGVPDYTQEDILAVLPSGPMGYFTIDQIEDALIKQKRLGDSTKEVLFCYPSRGYLQRQLSLLVQKRLADYVPADPESDDRYYENQLGMPEVWRRIETSPQTN